MDVERKCGSSVGGGRRAHAQRQLVQGARQETGGRRDGVGSGRRALDGVERGGYDMRRMRLIAVGIGRVNGWQREMWGQRLSCCACMHVRKLRDDWARR